MLNQRQLQTAVERGWETYKRGCGEASRRNILRAYFSYSGGLDPVKQVAEPKIDAMVHRLEEATDIEEIVGILGNEYRDYPSHEFFIDHEPDDFLMASFCAGVVRDLERFEPDKFPVLGQKLPTRKQNLLSQSIDPN